MQVDKCRDPGFFGIQPNGMSVFAAVGNFVDIVVVVVECLLSLGVCVWNCGVCVCVCGS